MGSFSYVAVEMCYDCCADEVQHLYGLGNEEQAKYNDL